MVRTFKERFLRFQLLFPDFYHFHHVIWGMRWAKTLKTKNGQNMSSGPFSHDAVHFTSGCEGSTPISFSTSTQHVETSVTINSPSLNFFKSMYELQPFLFIKQSGQRSRTLDLILNGSMELRARFHVICSISYL